MGKAKQVVTRPELSKEEKASVLESGPGATESLADVIARSERLNAMTKVELKRLAKSKDDKQREFVLSKEQFEKQQASKAAQAQRAAERAERDAAKAAREEKVKSKLGSASAGFRPTQSSFATLLGDEDTDDEDEKKTKSKKNLRRSRPGGEKKAEAADPSSAPSSGSSAPSSGLVTRLLLLVLGVGLVLVVLFQEHPALKPHVGPVLSALAAHGRAAYAVAGPLAARGAAQVAALSGEVGPACLKAKAAALEAAAASKPHLEAALAKAAPVAQSATDAAWPVVSSALVFAWKHGAGAVAALEDAAAPHAKQAMAQLEPKVREALAQARQAIR